MTNLHRPCTLWGETFDAYQNLDIVDEMRDYDPLGDCEDPYDTVIVTGKYEGIAFQKCVYKDEIIPFKMEAITTIAEALNAPVLATEEVLAGLPNDANFWLVDEVDKDASEPNGYPRLAVRYHQGEWEYGGQFGLDTAWYPLEANHNWKIQAFNCPKALQCLLQFTLDGKQKETE